MEIADHPAAETEDILDIMEQHEAHGARTVYTHTVQCSFPAHNCCGLVEWIVVVAQEIQLQPDTLHLAVDVMERFLSVVPVQWGQHLLAGAASLWIASKYEEIHPATAAEICHFMRNSHTISELVAMEASILRALDFRIALPTAWTFYGLYMQSADPDQVDQQLWFLAQYLLELSLLATDFFDLRPSARAAASVYLARHMLEYPQVWDAGLVGCSRFQEQDILPLAAQLAYTHMCVARAGIYNVSRNLYSDSSKQHVGLIPVCYELVILHSLQTWVEQHEQYKEQYRQYTPQPAPLPALQYKPAWMARYSSWESTCASAGPVPVYAPVPAALPLTCAHPYAPSLMSSYTDSTATAPAASSAVASSKSAVAVPAYAPYAPPSSSACYCRWCLHYGQCSCWQCAATPPQLPSSMSYYYYWQQQQQQQQPPSYGWTWYPATA